MCRAELDAVKVDLHETRNLHSCRGEVQARIHLQGDRERKWVHLQLCKELYHDALPRIRCKYRILNSRTESKY